MVYTSNYISVKSILRKFERITILVRVRFCPSDKLISFSLENSGAMVIFDTIYFVQKQNFDDLCGMVLIYTPFAEKQTPNDTFSA